MRYIKTPIRVFEYAPDLGLSDIQGDDGITYIEDIPTDAAREFAQAVNLHEELVAACRLLVSAMQFYLGRGDYVPVRIQIAADRAIGALAKLEADHAA